jgi:hypothetical protein
MSEKSIEKECGNCACFQDYSHGTRIGSSGIPGAIGVWMEPCTNWIHIYSNKEHRFYSDGRCYLPSLWPQNHPPRQIVYSYELCDGWKKKVLNSDWEKYTLKELHDD